MPLISFYATASRCFQGVYKEISGMEWVKKSSVNVLSQPAITCSKFKIETLEQGVKYVQS